jgi:hypothetical protein
MSEINILDYVKCVYERHNQIIYANNISEIEKYKVSLKNAISQLEYEIDDDIYMFNNKNILNEISTNEISTNEISTNYNTIVKVSLFSYLLNKIK